MGRAKTMKLSPAKKAWLTRKHNIALSGLKRHSPSKGPSEIKGKVHQLNGHGRYKHQWFVPSATDAKKVYKVSLTEDGQLLCDCPKFIFQRGPMTEHEPCTHILAVKKMGVKAG